MEQEDIFHHWETQSQGVSASRVLFCGFWRSWPILIPTSREQRWGAISLWGSRWPCGWSRDDLGPGGRNSCKQSCMQLGVWGVEMEILTPVGRVGTTFKPGPSEETNSNHAEAL